MRSTCQIAARGVFEGLGARGGWPGQARPWPRPAAFPPLTPPAHHARRSALREPRRPLRESRRAARLSRGDRGERDHFALLESRRRPPNRELAAVRRASEHERRSREEHRRGERATGAARGKVERGEVEQSGQERAVNRRGESIDLRSERVVHDGSTKLQEQRGGSARLRRHALLSHDLSGELDGPRLRPHVTHQGERRELSRAWGERQRAERLHERNLQSLDMEAELGAAIDHVGIVVAPPPLDGGPLADEDVEARARRGYVARSRCLCSNAVRSPRCARGAASSPPVRAPAHRRPRQR